MSERFFCAVPPTAGRAVLSGDEARHLAKVLRARVGDSVTLFAGDGRSWPARILRIDRSEVELETDPPTQQPVAPGPAVTLAVALPKGERQKWLVEKLTELGAARLVPLVTERGVAEATAGAVERMQRGVIEACKQCGRDRLMEIGTPATLAEVVASTPTTACGVVADPGGGPLDGALAPTAGEVIGLVGPEGGFTAAELELTTAAGWPRVALAPHILRVETAAVALAARLASATNTVRDGFGMSRRRPQVWGEPV
jgi:16S rRNA (uracil1498-N3)-methyltransferase